MSITLKLYMWLELRNKTKKIHKEGRKVCNRYSTPTCVSFCWWLRSPVGDHWSNRHHKLILIHPAISVRDTGYFNSFSKIFKKLLHHAPLQAFIHTQTHTELRMSGSDPKPVEVNGKSPIDFSHLCIISAWNGQNQTSCWWEHREQSSSLTPCPMLQPLDCISFLAMLLFSTFKGPNLLPHSSP